LKTVNDKASRIYTLVVSDGTLDATYDINVTQLATRGNVATNGFDSKTDDVTSTDSEIVIKFNQEDDITLNIAVNSSLEDIRDEINNNVEGIKSSILFDGSQYRLTLSSEETGSKGSVSSVEIVGIMNTEVSNIGQDARFTANGISITSPTSQLPRPKGRGS
jgi:flagellar hook-associated protein 2